MQINWHCDFSHQPLPSQPLLPPQYHNSRCAGASGIRESQLQKALLRVRPKLPTEASLAAAAATAQEAKQQALETAQPDQASMASLTELVQPDILQETDPMVQRDPPAQTDPPALIDHPATTHPPAKTAAVSEPSSGAVPPLRAVAKVLKGSSAGGAPDAMDTDMPHVIQAPDSEPEPVKAEEAAQGAESDRQLNAQLPHSDLEKSVPVLHHSMSCMAGQHFSLLPIIMCAELSQV